jgi:PAS domain S-box-containing protein
MSDTSYQSAAALRRRAEEIARKIALKRPQMLASLSSAEIRLMLYELQVRQIELELHNGELKRTRKELEASRARYFNFYDLAPVGFFTLDCDGMILEANLTAAGQLGILREELFGESFERFIHAADRALFAQHRDGIFAGSAQQSCDVQMQDQAGDISWVRLDLTGARDGEEGPLVCRIIASDISELKQREVYLELASRVLSILNQTDGFRDSVQQVLSLIRQSTGCDAVGMRLKTGDDYPYFAEEGFSAEFLRTENSLLARDPQADICRNEDGSIALQCTCGLVIAGKTDPVSSLFTAAGSCYTNDALTLLDLPAADDPRMQPRNLCIHEGYASVALIPLRTRDTIVGLLQLNDRRKGQFTPDSIHLLEGIASHIGEALLRKQVEEDLARVCRQLEQEMSGRTRQSS